MAFKKNVLVVANVTAASDELCESLTERAGREPAAFTLIVPADPAAGGMAAAEERVSEAVERLRSAGLEADGSVGHGDPIIAVSEAWDPRRYDEIVVSTLPIGSSKWLHAGLPERIFKLTGTPVAHIIATPPKPAPTVAHVRPHEDPVGLGPLNVLAWGAPHDEARDGHKGGA